MLLLLHIFIAISSLIVSAYLWMRPARGTIRISYGLITATVASGTALTVATHASLLQTCATGLIFLAVSIYGIIIGRQKLALQEQAE